MDPSVHSLREGPCGCGEVLVEHGADINKTWNNVTPLQVARQKNHPEIIHLLELAAQAGPSSFPPS